MPFEVGQRVGDYEVIQLLGAGGMGHVYRVRNIISNRMEAMKVLLPDLTAEPDLATRFISEIRTLASFDHPNIAKLNTALQAENQLIMMMEYVEGATLESLAGQRRLSVQDVAGYVSQTLSALAYAHERGVVHRDIKPANLMVTSHGIVKLMDFGIAKSNVENSTHTKPGTTMGSLYYMSPEQVRGAHVDGRSDLYSMGIVLYELLAGRRPFEADTTFSILNAQLNTPPQPPIEINPSLPRPINDIILRALAKDPNQRFVNAEEFRIALKPFVNSPNGQEVRQPAQAATQPMPAAAGATAPHTPAYNAPQAYGAPQPQSYPPAAQPQYGNQQWAQTPVPPPSSGSGKAVWIATGAVAVVLAMVGVGFAIPHFLHRNASAGTGTSSSADVSTTAATVKPVETPASSLIPLGGTTNPGTTPTGTGTGSSNAGSTGGSSGSSGGGSGSTVSGGRGRSDGGGTQAFNHPDGGHGAAGGKGGTQGTGGTTSTGGTSNGGATTQVPNAALGEAEERLMQTNVRAGTAKRGVSQMRNQLESQGLGLRGDVESAESRMDAYLHAAGVEVGRGNAAAAARNLDKAEADLAVLEKFLGH